VRYARLGYSLHSFLYSSTNFISISISIPIPIPISISIPSKPARRNVLLVPEGDTTARVALIIERQGDNKVQPKGRQVQAVPRFQHHLVDKGVLKVAVAVVVGVDPTLWVRPIDSGMAGRRVPLRIQFHVGALVGMAQHVPFLAVQNENEVPAHVVVRFGDRPAGSEPAVDPAGIGGVDHEDVVLCVGPEKGQLVEQECVGVFPGSVEAEVVVFGVRNDVVAVVVVVVVAVAPAAVDVVATLAALLPLPLKLATQ